MKQNTQNTSAPTSAAPAAPAPFNSHPRASIVVRFFGPGNFRGSRLKVTTQRGSRFFDYHHDLSGSDCFHAAAAEMLARFEVEDKAKYGPDAKGWGTLADFACGILPTGEHVYVSVRG